MIKLKQLLISEMKITSGIKFDKDKLWCYIVNNRLELNNLKEKLKKSGYSDFELRPNVFPAVIYNHQSIINNNKFNLAFSSLVWFKDNLSSNDEYKTSKYNLLNPSKLRDNLDEVKNQGLPEDKPTIKVNTAYVRQFFKTQKPPEDLINILKRIDNKKGLATLRQNQVVQNYIKGNNISKTYSTKH